MDLYRIGYRAYAANPLDGEGSFLFGGRWSSAATRMAYTSTTISLAMAEFLAHVAIDDLDADSPPALVVPSVHVPIATPERNVLVNPAHRHFERAAARATGRRRR